jgi:predicted nucleotide-binding protein
VCHGRSLLWHKVERYLEKDKRIPVQAWESTSRAGEHVIEVLGGLLNECAFAVVVVTGEDATADGSLRARQNVIHEIGLFQGKLGFKKVALLEQEGTESFSNIHGLQTIPFPDHRIEAAFPELERMLRREGVIK